MPAKFASLWMLSFAQDSSLTLVDSVRHTLTNWESSLCMSGKDRTFKVMVKTPDGYVLTSLDFASPSADVLWNWCRFWPTLYRVALSTISGRRSLPLNRAEPRKG